MTKTIHHFTRRRVEHVESNTGTQIMTCEGALNRPRRYR